MLVPAGHFWKRASCLATVMASSIWNDIIRKSCIKDAQSAWCSHHRRIPVPFSMLLAAIWAANFFVNEVSDPNDTKWQENKQDFAPAPGNSSRNISARDWGSVRNCTHAYFAARWTEKRCKHSIGNRWRLLNYSNKPRGSSSSGSG